MPHRFKAGCRMILTPRSLKILPRPGPAAKRRGKVKHGRGFRPVLWRRPRRAGRQCSFPAGNNFKPIWAKPGGDSHCVFIRRVLSKKAKEALRYRQIDDVRGLSQKKKRRKGLCRQAFPAFVKTGKNNGRTGRAFTAKPQLQPATPAREAKFVSSAKVEKLYSTSTLS